MSAKAKAVRRELAKLLKAEPPHSGFNAVAWMALKRWERLVRKVAGMLHELNVERNDVWLFVIQKEAQRFGLSADPDLLAALDRYNVAVEELQQVDAPLIDAPDEEQEPYKALQDAPFAALVAACEVIIERGWRVKLTPFSLPPLEWRCPEGLRHWDDHDPELPAEWFDDPSATDSQPSDAPLAVGDAHD